MNSKFFTMWYEGRTAMIVAAGMMICPVCAAQDVCYTSGGVAGIVIATIIVTLVIGGLTVAVARYLWNQRAAAYKGGEKATLPETCLPEKQLIGPKPDYAFDNPYFKDDDGGDLSATPDAAEKGEAGFASDRGDIDSSQNSKINSGPKGKKHKPFTNIPFYSVFGQGYKKTKSMDDTFISKQTERISVPLRGHDFTGLGFNICGNMRDGIFVKDVLHRGPASESGKMKAGDRIISVTVSFGSIVYEDALTILSYASPYDVKLEIEEGGGKNVLSATSSPGKRLASASFRNGGQRLFHPLYRSQSIDDLTQIGKESFLLQTKPAGSSSSYKRSQSTQASATKPRPQLKLSESAPDAKALGSSKRSTKSNTSSESSLSKKMSTETLGSSSCEELTDKKDVPISERQNGSFLKFVNLPLDLGENVNGSNSGATTSDSVNLELQVQGNTQKQQASEEPKCVRETLQQQHGEDPLFELKMPKAPPRKQNTPGKRKAPSPPRSQQPNCTATEIAAVVHQVDEAADSPMRLTSIITDKNENMGDNGELDVETYELHDKILEKTENSASTSGASLDSSEEISEPPSPKRKASSLGDLTKLNESRKKKTSTTILERAVSLDLQQQQSVPEGNLGRQKKILKPPAFNPEDTSEEDFQSVEDQEMSTKVWKMVDPWEKLPVSQVDTTADSDLENTISPAKEDISSFSILKDPSDSNTSITNGHHPTSHEIRNELDDISTSYLKANENTSLSGDHLQTFVPSTSDKSEYKNTTSTPLRKGAQFGSFLLEASSPIEHEFCLDDKKKHATSENESNAPDTMPSSGFSRGAYSLSSPVSLSIPIIPPVIHHYEKLSISPSCNKKDNLDSSREDSENTYTPSAIKPVFLTKQLKATNTVLTMSLSPDAEPVITKVSNETQESLGSKEKEASLVSSSSVNGDETDLSSVGQYRTAVEFPSVTANTLFVTSKISNTSGSMSASPTTDVTKKYSPLEALVESSVLGKDFSYSKKGVVSTKDDEELQRRNSVSNSPPPKLEPPQ